MLARLIGGAVSIMIGLSLVPYILEMERIPNGLTPEILAGFFAFVVCFIGFGIVYTSLADSGIFGGGGEDEAVPDKVAEDYERRSLPRRM